MSKASMIFGNARGVKASKIQAFFVSANNILSPNFFTLTVATFPSLRRPIRQPCYPARMFKPPQRPSPRTRKTDAVVERIAGAPIIAKPAYPRQGSLFDLPLPGWMRPCLPTLVDKPPVGPQWVHGIKWDGYRVSVSVEAGKVTIRTGNRARLEALPRYPHPAAPLKVRSAVLDGEAVILDDRGRSSFAELQADLDKHGSVLAVLYAFDLLFLDGDAFWTEPLYATTQAIFSRPSTSTIVCAQGL